MSYEKATAEEMLAHALGGESMEEMLEAISDDLKVLWLAQQSEALEPDEFGGFLTRLQARVDMATEFARRAKQAESLQASALDDELLRRLEALEARAGLEPAVRLHLVKPESEPGPLAGGPRNGDLGGGVD